MPQRTNDGARESVQSLVTAYGYSESHAGRAPTENWVGKCIELDSLELSKTIQLVPTAVLREQIPESYITRVSKSANKRHWLVRVKMRLAERSNHHRAGEAISYIGATAARICFIALAQTKPRAVNLAVVNRSHSFQNGPDKGLNRLKLVVGTRELLVN